MVPPAAGSGAVYAVIFIGAIHAKVRGQVANRPAYAAIGVTVDGRKDVLALTMSTGGGESAKFWMSVLVGLEHRGVKGVFFLVCDGLKGLPEMVENGWPQTIVQTRIIHLIRPSFRLVPRKYWDALKEDLRPSCTAPNRTPSQSRWRSWAKSGAGNTAR